MVNTFSEVYKLLGLKVNVHKSKVLVHNRQVLNIQNVDISIDNVEVENVERFKYLGGYISNTGSLDLEIQTRIQNACASINKLNKRVYKNNDINVNVKCQVYKSVTLKTLLYGCESWVLYRKHINQLEVFQQRFLRNLLKIKWQDHIRNSDVLQRAKCKSIEELITMAQLRWVGHLLRMQDNRLPKCVLYSELEHGARSKGGPKKRFKDSLKVVMENLNIGQDWEQLTQDRFT
jgi:hypothetical protein